jgi:hypothetical protein
LDEAVKMSLRSFCSLSKALCLEMNMDWVEEAKNAFSVEKPEHFTDFGHCEECAEHDETLRSSSVEEIGIEQLGNPGWDPICFSSAEGIKYYFPAMIRLSIETIEGEYYFDQLLFHLGYSGKENRLLNSFTLRQKEFVARFLWYMISAYSFELEENLSADEALSIYALWSES